MYVSVTWGKSERNCSRKIFCTIIYMILKTQVLLIADFTLKVQGTWMFIKMFQFCIERQRLHGSFLTHISILRNNIPSKARNCGQNLKSDYFTLFAQFFRDGNFFLEKPVFFHFWRMFMFIFFTISLFKVKEIQKCFQIFKNFK